MPVWASNYPVAPDTFTAAPQVDLVDTVFASHINTLATSTEAIETKLGITDGVATGFGGISINGIGIANPGTPGDPTLWVNTAAANYHLMYTDELNVDYDLMALTAPYNIGYGYTPVGVALGDVVALDPALGPNTVIPADATTPAAARRAIGVAINVGVTCDVLYAGEFSFAGYWGLFPHGDPLYLTAPGPTFGLALAPPGAPGTIIQELGFFRGTAPETFVFNPTMVSVI